MKLMVAPLAFALLTAAAPATQAQSAWGARIVPNKSSHSFGTLPYGGNGAVRFEITNAGNQPLLITRGGTNCGCVVVQIPSAPIMPGAKAMVSVRYDTKRPGAFRQTVYLVSNAANAPSLVLEIRGTVASKPA